MQVILTGGPYDSLFMEFDVDQNGVPKLHVLRMPHRASVATPPVMDECAAVNKITDHIYRLELFPNKEFVDGRWRDSLKKGHYEYLYQGR